MTHRTDRRCRKCRHTLFQHQTLTGWCLRSGQVGGCQCYEFDGRSDIEVKGQEFQKHPPEMRDSEKQAWAITGVLMVAFGQAEPDHGISKNPDAYVATFLDMARALLESEKVVWHEHTDKACCAQHGHHVSPHRRCMLR